MQNIYESSANSKAKSNIIVAGFTVFALLASYFLSLALSYYLFGFFDGLFTFGLALIITGISTFGSYYYSDKIIVGISGARRADSRTNKLFYQVMDNLCLGVNLPRPALYIIEDTAMNAFAAGRDPTHSLVCATTGLLASLDRTELEAVLAHELTHVKNYDTRLMSLAAVMVGSITLMADWLLRIGLHTRRNKDSGIGIITLVLGIAAALLAPIIGQLLQLAISRSREYMADVGSVKITRQPGGLISALTKIDHDLERLEAANKSTAHLYFTNPFHQDSSYKATFNRPGIDWFAGLFNTHPPIADRIKALSQMS